MARNMIQTNLTHKKFNLIIQENAGENHSKADKNEGTPEAELRTLTFGSLLRD